MNAPALEVNAAKRPPIRLTVLGGTGSGIPNLMQALRDSQRGNRLGDIEVRLFARNAMKVERVVRYIEAAVLTTPSAARLTLTAHTNLEQALRDASHIACLVRVGGMSGRARDEALALEAGVPADEGLAAGGLACFLRSRTVIRELAAQCRMYAPQATFLQMSSPLGLCLAITREQFGEHAYGLCELPRTTLKTVLKRLADRMPNPGVTARYAGLNHQGCLYAFKDRDGNDRTREVLDAIDSAPSLDVTPDAIRAWGAVPLPYLRMYLHTQRVVDAQRRAPLRGTVLAAWQERLTQAYCAGSEPDVAAIRSLLESRRMDWFEECLAPVLEALSSEQASCLPINVPNAGALDGVEPAAIVEVDCHVSNRGIHPLRAPEPPAQPFALTRRLTRYEQAVLQLGPEPTLNDLAEVAAMHPLTPPQTLQPLAARLSAIRPDA